MPARSAITTLPEQVRQELDRRLVAGSFSDYTALADWLAEQGWGISRSALHRYGQQFQSKIDDIRRSTEMARALREQVGDDDGALNDASLRMAQRLLFDVMQKVDPGQIEEIEIPKLVRALADLSRASVGQKKWQQQYDEAVRRRAAEAAEAVETAAKSSGVSADGIAFMRRQILGIPDHA